MYYVLPFSPDVRLWVGFFVCFLFFPFPYSESEETPDLYFPWKIDMTMSVPLGK